MKTMIDQYKGALERIPAYPPALATACSGEAGTGVIVLVDEDTTLRDGLRLALEYRGWTVAGYATGEACLAAYPADQIGCFVVEADLPGMAGLDLLHRLRALGHLEPVIIMAGKSDVPLAVRAINAGAADFIEKPQGQASLLRSISVALAMRNSVTDLSAWQSDATGHIALLTRRQREIMILIVAGQPNKIIAADLGISQRTVENHRASIMRKTGAKSLPALARLALMATLSLM